MGQSLKNALNLYTCWSPILALPTGIILGMVTTCIFGAKYVLLPVFAVLILTWLFVAVYFESYSSLQESFDKNLGVGLTVYNTIGLVVLTYLVFSCYGVLLVEMTPPTWK